MYKSPQQVPKWDSYIYERVGTAKLRGSMVMDILISVILLFVGIAILVTIHVCIVGRAFGRSYMNNGGGGGGGGGGVDRMGRSPSMSNDDIEKLPCFDYKMEERQNGAAAAAAVECTVCLENFKVGEKCRLLPKCRHSFHAECIDSWLLKTGACPICRTVADSTNLDGESSVSGEVGVELTER